MSWSSASHNSTHSLLLTDISGFLLFNFRRPSFSNDCIEGKVLVGSSMELDPSSSSAISPSSADKSSLVLFLRDFGEWARGRGSGVWSTEVNGEIVISSNSSTDIGRSLYGVRLACWIKSALSRNNRDKSSFPKCLVSRHHQSLLPARP